MSIWLWGIWIGVVIQRLIELRLSWRNIKWMKSQGGIEIGREHYPWLVAIHLLFFAGLLIEVLVFGASPPKWWWIPLFLFLVLQRLRFWCIQSLGSYWNTRIFIVPGHKRRVEGPYRFIRHPNYAVVMLEILILPLIFGAYMTAVFVSIINAWFLIHVRIPIEEKALSMQSEDGDIEKSGRLVPTDE
jgi:methyltransferase